MKWRSRNLGNYFGFQSFKSAQIESRDGEKLVQSMADDIRAMMELKISAVKRIVEAAENMAFDKQSEPVPEDYQFYNSKEMDEPYDDISVTTTVEPEFALENWIIRPPTKSAHLQLNAHFYNIPVNTNFSSVHVPTNVYAWGRCFIIFVILCINIRITIYFVFIQRMK